MTLRPLAHPVKNVLGRIEWGREHDFCWVCGISRDRTFGRVFPPGLHTHHIIKPMRSDEPCNYARLCARCHDIVEGHRVPHSKGGHFPPITLANVLWLKLRYDSENYDPERLAVLWGRVAMPEPEPLEALCYVDSGRSARTNC